MIKFCFIVVVSAIFYNPGVWARSYDNRADSQPIKTGQNVAEFQFGFDFYCRDRLKGLLEQKGFGGAENMIATPALRYMKMCTGNTGRYGQLMRNKGIVNQSVELEKIMNMESSKDLASYLSKEYK